MLEKITNSIRSRLIFANLAMLIPLLIMAFVGYVTFERIFASFDQALSESIDGIVPITRLEYQILSSAIPLHGYLISGSRDEIVQFEAMRNDIEAHFKLVRELKQLKDKQRIILRGVEKEWHDNLKLAKKIIEFKPPFGTDAAVMMELFDLRIKKLNDKLLVVRKYITREIYDIRERTKGQQVRSLYSSIMIFLLGTLIAVSIGVYIGRSILRPLKNLERAAEEFTSGNMGYRVDEITDDEIGKFARTFNTMAQEIESLVIHDPLTGLLNKREFDKLLLHEVKRARRYSKPLSLLMIDIDHFKRVNDKYGHQVGDIVLRLVSSLLANNIRSIDHAARYGGEELVIILPEVSKSDAVSKAESLRKSIEEEKYLYNEHEYLNVTVSIGVATYDIDASDGATLVSASDKALYIAKRNGRNRVEVYQVQ